MPQVVATLSVYTCIIFKCHTQFTDSVNTLMSLLCPTGRLVRSHCVSYSQE